MRTRRLSGAHVLAAVFALGTVAPFLCVLVLALSPAHEPTLPQTWPSRLTLENLQATVRAGSFARWTLNSFIYALVSVVIILLTAAMAGYAFAKKRFPGRELIFWSFLATLMVPAQATLIPMFLLVSKLNGVDTYWGLIVPTLANSQAVFLMRQFIRDLPDELFEAAKVDGAGEWRVFWQIVLPLTRPILATLGIFVFLWHWNDFLWPLVMSQQNTTRTLTVGLATLNTESAPLAQIMSGALIAVVPCLVIFAVLQRHIVASIASSGIKG